MKQHSKIMKLGARLLFIAVAAGVLCSIAALNLPVRIAHAQQPTGSIPTVTGTPPGPVVTVYSDQNIIGVFAGPSSYFYPQIGVLLSGESAPALAYSADGNWIQIIYLGVHEGNGWVYAPYVSLSPGALPRIPNPPTATPRTTPTLDPTYVAAFGLQLDATRLPTFTPPPPLKLPAFTPASGTGSAMPFGFFVLGLALVGVLGAIISFLRGNR